MRVNIVEQRQEEADRFSAALKWYFQDKPRGSRASLAKRIGKARNFVSYVEEKHNQSGLARRLICHGLGVEYAAMLDAGRKILKDLDPGPAFAWVPEDKLHGVPTYKELTNTTVGTVLRETLNVPLSKTLSLAYGPSGKLDIIPDMPIAISLDILPGYDYAGLKAVACDIDTLGPEILKNDIIVVDTAIRDIMNVRPDELYLAYFRNDGTSEARCVPRHLSKAEKEDSVMASLNGQGSVCLKTDIRIIGRVRTLVRTCF